MPLAALWAALLIVFGLVVPVLAVEGPTKLLDPSVSPRSGLPTTAIHFAVTYRNREGSAPDHVNVIIDGTAHRMTGDGGATWKQGVRHAWSTTLPVGVHTVVFEAGDTRKFGVTIDGGSVTITAPPSPTPSPVATPKPTPKPTPTPAPRATPTPTPAATATPKTDPTPTPAPTTRPTPAPTPTATPGNPTTTPTSTPGDGGTPGSGDTTPGSGGTPPGGSGGTTPGGSGGTTPGGGTGGTTGSGDGSTGSTGTGNGATGTGGSGATGSTTGSSNGNGVVTAGPGWGSLASALDILGINQPPAISALPMLVGLTGAMAVAFAFAIFGKKRRDEEPPAPDEVLQANAARGHAVVPNSDFAAGVVRAPGAPMPGDAEAGMPRWRRPSLLEARKADPARYVSTTQRLSFDGTDDTHERRVIRYRVVRLLDAPDELRSAEIGQLDQGDEVQLLERSGAYWLVLCPDGRQGWLHKMTLGDIVTDTAPATPWNGDVESDVLSAFLQARARA